MAAQVRAMLPQFWGIYGSTSTICSINGHPPRDLSSMGAGKTAPALVNRWYCNATEMKMQLKNAKTPRIFLEIQKMTAVSMEKW